jgi:photosystem II stability/assembly factor-like uncharacterized protein
MVVAVLLFALRIGPELPDVQFRQPQLATDGRTVALAFGAGDAVYFARSSDHGQTFSKPVLIAKSGKLSLGMHRGPRLAITPQAIVVSAIVGEQGRGQDGDLLAWRSTDGGETWSQAVKVNDVPGSAREGLHAMAYGGGVLYSTWLDLRAKGMQLYGAVSKDGGKTWAKNALVYKSPSGAICTCCHPSVTVDSNGVISVMFRNSLEGARDMYILRSRDGGSTFTAAEKLGRGTWPLNACPMDGGGLAMNDKGEVSTAWRREKQIYFAAPGQPERLLGAGKDPAVAVTPRGTYVAWTGSTGGVKALVPGRPQPIELAAEGGYAQLLVLPAGKVLAAWENKGSLSVEVLP